MDRWHAAGTGKPSQIPDSSVVAPAGLENTVGEVCYYLIRKSITLFLYQEILLLVANDNLIRSIKIIESDCIRYFYNAAGNIYR